MIDPKNMLTCCVEHITPAISMKYLAMNAENPRKRINQQVVNAYAEDMKAGRWLLNGEPICFDSNGNLKDGQHRLWGVVRSGVSVDILVVRGVSPDYDLYDYGLKRNLSQECGLPHSVESVASVIVTNGATSGSAIPRMLVRDYLVDHADALQQAYKITSCGTGNRPCRKRDIVLGVYILLRNGTDEETLTAFCKVVNQGLPIDGYECSPALAFRTKLDNWNITRSYSTIMSNLEYFFRAFNDFAAGNRRMSKYKIKSVEYAERLFMDIRAKDGLLQIGAERK